MYKLYVRPYLDYGDVIYHRDDPEMNSSLTKRLESVQYSTALAIAGAWRGTSYDKLLDELEWEYLYHRRWLRRLTFLQHSQWQLAELPQPKICNYNLRSEGVFECRDLITHSSHIAFGSGMSRTATTLSQFKNELIKCIGPPKRSNFKTDDIFGIKLLTRIRLGFSHLREDKHRHNFPVSPICTCGTEPEATEHFLLRCQRFSQIRSDILDNACELSKTDFN